MPVVEVTAHALNIRSAPFSSASAPYALAQGEQATVDSYIANSWLHVTAPHPGYIYASPTYVRLLDVSVTPPSDDSTTQVRVNTALLNVRSGPGMGFAVKSQRTHGTFLTVYAHHNVVADGHNWFQLASAEPQWIAGELTINVGSAPPAPIPAPVPNQPQLPWVLPFSAAARGVHGNAGGWSPAQAELDLIAHNRIETIFIPAWESGQAAQSVAAYRRAGVKNFILRASLHGIPHDPRSFVDQTLPIILDYVAQIGGTPMIQLFNEVNLVTEGWRSAWVNGSEFALFFAKVAADYRAALAGVKLGFPALSPGPGQGGLRMDERVFANDAIAAIRSCDWIGLHAYWARGDGSDFAPNFTLWKTFRKPLIGTEIGAVSPAVVTVEATRRAYGIMAGAGVPCMAWLLDGTGSFNEASWTLNHIML